MNRFRVDRVNSTRVPCGMNSIRYIGDDWAKARRIYEASDVGFDTWGVKNATFGVALSVFDEISGEYVVKCHKGLSK